MTLQEAETLRDTLKQSVRRGVQVTVVGRDQLHKVPQYAVEIRTIERELIVIEKAIQYFRR